MIVPTVMSQTETSLENEPVAWVKTTLDQVYEHPVMVIVKMPCSFVKPVLASVATIFTG